MFLQQSHGGQFTVHGYFGAIRRIEAIGRSTDLLVFRLRGGKLDQVSVIDLQELIQAIVPDGMTLFVLSLKIQSLQAYSQQGQG